MLRLCVVAALCAIGLLGNIDLPPSAAGEPSGKAWVKKFPGSKELKDLDPGFQADVEAFSAALKAAGATIDVNSTLRPKERAYLMHWSWEIAKNDFDPKKVPAMEAVEISWWHGDAASSKAKAAEMVEGYGIANLGVPPALASRHTEGKAIDMQITWSESLSVKAKDGSTVTIAGGPRDSTNPDLIKVGKTYGVIHFTNVPKDKVHWSTDGH